MVVYGVAGRRREGVRMVTPGTVEAVGAGDHACLTLSDTGERLGLVADYGYAASGTGPTVLWQYDRDRFDPVTLMAAAQARHHTVAAAVYHDDGLLRVCRQYRPPGLRLAGEIDATHAEVLVAALAEALRLDHDLYVNLAALRFIDASSASAIVRAALSLPADRTMTVMCRGVVLDMIKLCGAGEAQQLRVRERHGES